MISLQKFLLCVEMNAARTRRYQLGGDGSDGDCDCIGLIMGAIDMAGGEWGGTHGSNFAARNRTRNLRPLKTGELFAGEIVYKAKAPGENGYALPEKYKSGGDLLDYYHVGVVTGISPLKITHCTSVAGGIKVDTALGKWAWGGELSLVDYSYGGGEQPMDSLYTAVVTADNKYPVKMRSDASANAKVLCQVPQGTEVEVLEERDAAWAKIYCYGRTGFMMRKFLRAQALAGLDADNEPDLLSALENLRDQLVNALEAIDVALSEVNRG